LIGQHKEEPYLAINPTGDVPTLVHGNTSVIGGYSTFLTYLASTFPALGRALYPANAQAEIDAHLLWYQCILSPATQKLVRTVVGPKAFGEKQCSTADSESITDEIWEIILVKLEQNLEEKGRNFFCSDDQITIVDIQYYNDIMQILVIEGPEAMDEF